MWRLSVIFLMAVLSAQGAEPLNVVVSTTLLEGIARSVGGDRVKVTSVIPYAMCPGHFDLSPHMAAAITGTDLFVQHGFETFTRGLAFADDDPRRVILKIDGNGMIPDVHREITARLTEALCAARPDETAAFRANADVYAGRIRESEQAVQAGRDSLAGIPVMAAVMNAPFVTWTGCRVVGSFPRDEGLSAKALVDLVREGRKEGVRLIVDNKQSLGRAGQKLAQELGVPLVVLSNFPDADRGGYPPALRAALEQLTAAVEVKAPERE